MRHSTACLLLHTKDRHHLSGPESRIVVNLHHQLGHAVDRGTSPCLVAIRKWRILQLEQRNRFTCGNAFSGMVAYVPPARPGFLSSTLDVQCAMVKIPRKFLKPGAIVLTGVKLSQLPSTQLSPHDFKPSRSFREPGGSWCAKRLFPRDRVWAVVDLVRTRRRPGFLEPTHGAQEIKLKRDFNQV